jgi:hypothetical protein
MAIFLSLNNKTDQCVWYFLNFLVDTTIGIVICFGLLLLVKKAADKYNIKDLQSGLYYEMIEKKGKKVARMKIKMYCYQLGVWILIVIIVNSF